MLSHDLPDVVVLGAGRIGSANDAVPNMTPLSHVGAILQTRGIRLKVVVEPNQASREVAARQWKDRTSALFAESIDSLGGVSADVVVLCTPIASREEDIAEALGLQPKILVVEKPFAASVESAVRILNVAENAGVEIIVNYNRRFDPATADFHALFPGTPVMVVARYGKGLGNYASHMVDLLDTWFGPIVGVQAISKGRAFGDDQSISFRMQFEGEFDVYVLSLDDLSFDQFEIDFFFADRQMSYLAGGAERQVRFPAQDLHYRGYAHLTAVPSETWQGQIGGFVELYESICDHLKSGVPLVGCTGAEALRVLQVLEGVQNSANCGGQLVRI